MSEIDKFDKLNNVKAKNIEISENIVTFELENGEIISFETWGNCCSSSWIEHFDIPITPCHINSFKQIDISPSFDPKPTKTDNYEEEMEYYFYEINTDKGSFLIEMRNSSNGYYGGYLE
jgi:hypothetical protein